MAITYRGERFSGYNKPKRRGVHKKTQSKSEKRQKKQTRYKGQGR